MIRVMLFEDGTNVFSDDFEGKVVIGRAEVGEPAPFSQVKRGEEWKLVLATFEDKSWSRSTLTLTPVAGATKFLVHNGGNNRTFTVEGIDLRPGGNLELTLPAVIKLDHSKIVRVQAGGGQMGALPNATIPPLTRKPPARLQSLAALGAGVNQKEVIAWLNAATDVLQAAVNSDEFFDRAVTAAVQMVGLDSAQLLLRRTNHWQPFAVKHARDDISQIGRPSGSILRQLVREKRTLWETLDGLQSAQTSLVGVGAVIAAPVLDRTGQVIGALYCERRGRATSTTAPPVSEAEAMLVELLARGVAAGLARQKHEEDAAVLRNELEIGRELQNNFLPATLPQLPGWEIATKFKPAREVSGDFYDVFALSENHVGLTIADVCGKGVGAALFMAMFRSLIRAFFQQGLARDLTGSLLNQLRTPAPKGDRDLVTLLIEMNTLTTITLINNYVAQVHGDTGMFATVFLGVLDTRTGTVHYVNAGHDSPIHLGPGGVKGRLNPGGPAAGLFLDRQFTVETVTLEPGDLLFCYTDGVTEARSPTLPPKENFFTEKRLLDLVSQPYLSAVQVLDKVEATVLAHIGTGPPSDDVTLLAVYRNLTPVQP